MKKIIILIAGLISATASRSFSQPYLPLAGGALTGGLVGTTATFSGLITSTRGGNAPIFRSTGGGTGYQYINIVNDGGSVELGLGPSTHAGYTSGSLPYAAIFGSSGGRPTQLMTNNIIRMTIDPDGNVGIGTLNPSEALAVNGNIRSKEVKVEITGWPDFVFEPGYNLPDLKETEQFIKENKHLPEIPSAKEVAENGISLGEMNAKFLKKIEEMTLYIIELKKEGLQREQMIQELQTKNK